MGKLLLAMLTTRTKESIKTALAMTIAYAIALQMDWDKPMWAGFAVAFVSLANVGQSLNKAALRMFGTVIAMVVAFTFIAITAQDRWPFMLLVSLWLALCTYRMAGARHQYFWNVCGFVSVIICMDAGPDSANAFHIAMLRFQQTGLGILVYSLVSIFIWPLSSGPDFHASARRWASTQRSLLNGYFGLFTGHDDSEQTQSLVADEHQASAGFGQLQLAAETDDYEVWEQRVLWREYQRLTSQLTETLQRWRESFAELQQLEVDRLIPGLEVERLIPGLKTFRAELDSRLQQVGRMLDGQAPDKQPVAVEPGVNVDEVRRLSHFQRAAVVVSGARLRQLDANSHALFDCVSNIKGFGGDVVLARETHDMAQWLVIDPDRFAAAARIMAVMWLAYLGYIYIDGIPAGTAVVSAAAPLGMALSVMPQLRVSKLVVPVATGVLIAGIAYIFVMPHLSHFAGLGLLIFSITFAMCYWFAKPQQMLGRAFGLAMFVLIAGISNEQTYSFVGAATTALLFPTIFLILAITAYIPYSPRPERAFMRLLGRFFRSCEYLTSTMEWDPAEPLTKIRRVRKNFHTREVTTLPAKLAVWEQVHRSKGFAGDHARERAGTTGQHSVDIPTHVGTTGGKGQSPVRTGRSGDARGHTRMADRSPGSISAAWP